MGRGWSVVLIAGSLALAACGGGDSRPTPESLPLSQLTAEVTAEVTAAEVTAATSVATESATAAVAAGAAVDTAGATAAVASGPPSPGGVMPGMGPGVMGEITAVDGSTLTVQDERQQTVVAVLLTADTQVYKQAAVDLAAVPVDETILAQGSQEGDVFTAAQVQVGMAGAPGGPGGAPGGMVPPDGQQPPVDMTPPADGQLPPDANGNPGGLPAGGMGGAMLSGTVTAAAVGGLTVQTADGSTVQLVLADGGQATQQVQATAADLALGAQVRVLGGSDGATVTATRVVIMAAGE